MLRERGNVGNGFGKGWLDVCEIGIVSVGREDVSAGIDDRGEFGEEAGDFPRFSQLGLGRMVGFDLANTIMKKLK